MLHRPKEDQFYRVATLFSKQASRWLLVDQDVPERERLKRMRNYDCSKYKATLEPVFLSDGFNADYEDAVEWRLQHWSEFAHRQDRRRCQLAFLGDVYILPGRHLVSKELPADRIRVQFDTARSMDMTGFVKKLNVLLKEEMADPGLHKDTRRLKTVTHALRLLLKVAPETTHTGALAAGRVISSLTKSENCDHASLAAQIAQQWKQRDCVVKRPHISE